MNLNLCQPDLNLNWFNQPDERDLQFHWNLLQHQEQAPSYPFQRRSKGDIFLKYTNVNTNTNTNALQIQMQSTETNINTISAGQDEVGNAVSEGCK